MMVNSPSLIKKTNSRKLAAMMRRAVRNRRMRPNGEPELPDVLVEGDEESWLLVGKLGLLKTNSN